MSRFSSLTYGLWAMIALTAFVAAEYSSNMFLNGEYQKNLPFNFDFRANPAAEFTASLLSKRATPFVGQQYLPSLLECRGRQQCVPTNKCYNGFFNEQLPKIQSCAPEDNVCCTYNPPATPAPVIPTQAPYVTCSTNMACVNSRDCRNNEVLSNAVVNLEIKQCYAPNVCCGISSTMLTEDGYVLKTPPSPFTYPAPEPYRPTTPLNNNYLPPAVTESKPAPIIPSTPTRAPYRPVYTTARTPFTFAPTTQRRFISTTPAQYLPPVRRISTQPPTYLPPLQDQKSNEIPRDRDVQPTNQKNVVLRGEDQLSPQIFPSPKPKPQPTRAQIQPANRPQKVDRPKNVQSGSDQLGPQIFPQSKCASALLCTPENFCSSIGVISESPVEITPFRVPLTDCKVEGTGAPGKCCRDPNYVDPWPVNLAGVCAQRNKNTSPRGIKDIDANFAEIPWQAMILKESTKELLCGGAIIGDGVVLTTASCVKGVNAKDIRVKAGEYQLGSTSEPQPFQLVSVKSIATHPKYDASTGSNDMAVIQLQERLSFASHIQPICISDKDPSASETCVTTGWGKQALGIHEEGAILHVTTTTPASRSDCSADSGSVCSSTKFDACQFDSGSALACGTGTSVMLKGIYSVENGCGEGQVVRFIKPDVAWVNQQFLERTKPLLLRL